ncbi:MAG: hypothetical protein ACRDVD_08935, partial [Acidimicrobiia bacterium]
MTATILSTESSDGSMARFRASVQRRSVALGWVVVIVLGAQAVRESVFQDNRFLVPIVGFALLLVASAIVDWEALMSRPSAAWAAWAWIVAVTVSVGVIATVPELQVVSQPLFFGVVALSGLVLEPPKHAFVSILSAAIVGLTSLANGTAGALAVVVVSLATVAVATALLGIEFERAVLR